MRSYCREESVDESSSSSDSEMAEATEFVNGEEKERKPLSKKAKNQHKLDKLKEKLEEMLGTNLKELSHHSTLKKVEKTDVDSNADERVKKPKKKKVRYTFSYYDGPPSNATNGHNVNTNQSTDRTDKGYNSTAAPTLPNSAVEQHAEMLKKVREQQRAQQSERLESLLQLKKSKTLQIQALESQASLLSVTDPAYYAYFTRTGLLKSEIADLDQSIANLSSVKYF